VEENQLEVSSLATTMRVREMRSKGGSVIDPKRTGTFTTAVGGELGRQTMIL